MVLKKIWFSVYSLLTEDTPTQMSLNNIISTGVCPTHGVCFCQSCISDYKINKFTTFQNTCSHEESQCQAAAFSVTFITPLDLASKYTEHLMRQQGFKLVPLKHQQR